MAVLKGIGICIALCASLSAASLSDTNVLRYIDPQYDAQNYENYFMNKMKRENTKDSKLTLQYYNTLSPYYIPEAKDTFPKWDTKVHQFQPGPYNLERFWDFKSSKLNEDREKRKPSAPFIPHISHYPYLYPLHDNEESTPAKKSDGSLNENFPENLAFYSGKNDKNIERSYKGSFMMAPQANKNNLRLNNNYDGQAKPRQTPENDLKVNTDRNFPTPNELESYANYLMEKSDDSQISPESYLKRDSNSSTNLKPLKTPYIYSDVNFRVNNKSKADGKNFLRDVPNELELPLKEDVPGDKGSEIGVSDHSKNATKRTSHEKTNEFLTTFVKEQMRNSGGSGASITLKKIFDAKSSNHVDCDMYSTPRYTCYNCYNYMECKDSGGKIKPCKDPLAPYCNGGICSSVPGSLC